MQWRHCRISLAFVGYRRDRRATQNDGPPGRRPTNAVALLGHRRQRRHRLWRQRALCAVRSRLPGGHRLRLPAEAAAAERRATVTLSNRSVPGAVLSPAIQTLSRDIGRDILSQFLDQDAPFIAERQYARHDLRGRQRRQRDRAEHSRRARRRRTSAGSSINTSISGAPISTSSFAGCAHARPTRASSRSTCRTSARRRMSPAFRRRSAASCSASPCR